MRKSIIKQDKGYDSEAYKYDVYLDDVKMEYVFTADEEEGFITVFNPDNVGSFLKSPPDKPIMKKLEGKVEIINAY